MNESTVRGKWSEIKGDIQQMWGKLTHDELDRTKGNINAIGGLIEQRYGETKDAVSKKLNEIFNKGAKVAGDKSEQAKDYIDEKLSKADKIFNDDDRH